MNSPCGMQKLGKILYGCSRLVVHTRCILIPFLLYIECEIALKVSGLKCCAMFCTPTPPSLGLSLLFYFQFTVNCYYLHSKIDCGVLYAMFSMRLTQTNVWKLQLVQDVAALVLLGSVLGNMLFSTNSLPFVLVTTTQRMWF